MKITRKQLKQIIKEELMEAMVGYKFYEQKEFCRDLRFEKEQYPVAVQQIIEHFWDKSPNTWIKFRSINRSTGQVDLEKFKRILPTAMDEEIYQAGNFLDQWFLNHCYNYYYLSERNLK